MFTFFTLSSLFTAAQIPQSFNYQAIARNANNNVIPNQFISVEISIRDGSPTATIVYQEIDTATTNQFGLFTVAISTGQVQVGTNLTTINWATGNKYLQVGFDQSGGNNFIIMGTTQLLSVPYALYAGNSGNSAGFVHYIGQLYGGGIVVAVWKDSSIEHGLIASLTDVSDSSEWSNITTQIGSAAQSPNNGLTNTSAIIAQSGQIASAALLCRNYTAGGYSDWYLPAMWELTQCYNAAIIVNEVLGGTNGFKVTTYWSSTEEIAGAWYQNFGANPPSPAIVPYTVKENTYSVRAVRRY